MTSIELTAIQTLRQKGYAVAVWEPSEIGIADPRALEDQATSLFPNEASLLRLTSALLCEINEEWLTGKTYLNMNPADLPQN